MTDRIFLRCVYCGQFIKHSDFDDGKAIAEFNQYCRETMSGPELEEDSHQYHTKCKVV